MYGYINGVKPVENKLLERRTNMSQWISITLLVGAALAAVLFRMFYGVV